MGCDQNTFWFYQLDTFIIIFWCLFSQNKSWCKTMHSKIVFNEVLFPNTIIIIFGLYGTEGVSSFQSDITHIDQETSSTIDISVSKNYSYFF